MDSVFRQIHLLDKAYNLHGNCSAHNYTFMACIQSIKVQVCLYKDCPERLANNQ